MKLLKRTFMLLLSVVLVGGTVLEASADRVYDSRNNRWVDSSELQSSGRRGSSVRRTTVDYDTKLAKGTIIVETSERRLYYVLGNGKAVKYGVGVGRDGFRWSGTHRITRKAEWPGWTPPPAMRKRVPGLPAYMPGGPKNPLGARAFILAAQFIVCTALPSPGLLVKRYHQDVSVSRMTTLLIFITVQKSAHGSSFATKVNSRSNRIEPGFVKSPVFLCAFD